MLQRKAGIVNRDYAAQRAILEKVDKGEISLDDFKGGAAELMENELAATAKK